MTFSNDQLHTLAIVERCASILSILGIATIIGIFWFSRQFRNPIHRIVFINAFYNLFDVVATTIALSGPKAGNHSALCQFQGFLMQMFPLADVLWTLAMALDVFLIVFYKYEAEDLRKLELKYVTVITALVFIPALTFLFIHTPERGPMYGSVTIWCSISPHWVLFRIIFFYGPIWLIISVVMMLYVLVGIEILKRRHVFKSIGRVDYLDLDTIVAAHNSAKALSQPKSPSPAVPIAKLHDKTETGNLSLSSSTSHPRPSDAITSSHGVAHPSHISFRQYILMPLMFFVVLLAIWVAPTTNRISAFINPDFQSYPLLLAVVSTGSLRGFWNAVVFITLGMKERKRRKRLNRTWPSLGA